MGAYIFSADEQAVIAREFGADFYEHMKETLELCAEKWHLSVSSLLPYFSVNCVFTCRSAQYGDAVLKIGRKPAEAVTEAGVLTEYNGRRFCKLYEFDRTNGALLIERLSPGQNLFYKTNSGQRIDAFAKLYHGLHNESQKPGDYPTYRGWIDRFISLAEKREDIKAHGHMALQLYDEIAQTYTKKMLLHGDLHHENILSDGADYRIIDPKGVIGDPVFECSRFILDEFGDKLKPSNHTDIIDFTKKLGESTAIPPDVLLKCMYIETVIWMGEDLFYFNWLDKLMVDNTVQAEMLMKLL
jgi:streptomycin 6-kinase